jgi:plastocyanin
VRGVVVVGTQKGLPMTRWIRLVGAIFALSLVFAACGDDSGGNDPAGGASSGGDDTAGQYGAPADSGGPCDADVCMREISYQPDSMTVSAGDTVTWSNVDGTDHTVTADDGSFDSGTLSDGDTFEFTFDEAGEFTYHCEIHSDMTGTVTVE